MERNGFNFLAKSAKESLNSYAPLVHKHCIYNSSFLITVGNEKIESSKNTREKYIRNLKKEFYQFLATFLVKIKSGDSFEKLIHSFNPKISKINWKNKEISVKELVEKFLKMNIENNNDDFSFSKSFSTLQNKFKLLLISIFREEEWKNLDELINISVNGDIQEFQQLKSLRVSEKTLQAPLEDKSSDEDNGNGIREFNIEKEPENLNVERDEEDDILTQLLNSPSVFDVDLSHIRPKYIQQVEDGIVFADRNQEKMYMELVDLVSYMSADLDREKLLFEKHRKKNEAWYKKLEMEIFSDEDDDEDEEEIEENDDKDHNDDDDDQDYSSSENSA